MNEHWLLYTSDREHGGTAILGIFNSSDDAFDYYNETHNENERYYNIRFIERWENNKLVESL